MGIGASAGGLEAFEQFFARVPLNAGMAYIVVQHLDPTQKAMLAELLQRVTALAAPPRLNSSPVSLAGSRKLLPVRCTTALLGVEPPPMKIEVLRLVRFPIGAVKPSCGRRAHGPIAASSLPRGIPRLR